MIALLLAAAIGATTFVEQDLPGLEAGSRQFPSTLVPTNVKTVDINRDGQTDLILPNHVRLQTAGKFPDTARIRLPENAKFDAMHLENDVFYGCGDSRLACYRFFDGAWSLYWEATVPWERTTAATPIFQDIDGDGRAELLMPDAGALLVARLDRGVQVAGTLDIYPPRRAQTEPLHDLWQARLGPQSPASASRRFRLAFADSTVTVRETLEGGPGTLEYRRSSYQIDVTPEDEFSATQSAETERTAVARLLSPCVLNAGDAADFAGLRAAAAPSPPWSTPITDVLISVDGADRQTIRTKALQSWVSLADFDADGDADLIVETSDFYDRPPREVMLSAASSRRLRHVVSVYVQEVDGHFSESRRELVRVVLRFDEPLAKGGPRWMTYRAGGLVATQGDFNGDRRSDVVVWDSPHRIAVYMNHEGLFRANEDFSFAIPDEYDRIEAVDVDRDGKSDIVVLPAASGDAPPKVFFSR